MAELALENNFRRQLNQERGGETIGQFLKTFNNKSDFKHRLGKEVAHRIGKRYLPQDMMDELENLDFDEIAGESLKHFAARFAGNYYKGKVFRNLVADPLKQAATRAIMNKLKIAFGATLIGLIVSWLIQTAQMIWGNWLHKFWMPSLYIWEQFVWGVGAVIVIILIIASIIMFIMMLINALGPIAALAYFGNELFELLKDWIIN